MGTAEALGGFRQEMLGGAFCIRQYVRISEQDDPSAFALQMGCAPLIGCRALDRRDAAYGELGMARYARQPLPFREGQEEGRCATAIRGPSATT